MAISKRKRVHAFWLMAALPLCAKAAAPVEQAVSTSVAPHSAASEANPTFALGAGVVVSPLYEGSSRYAVFPSLVAKAVMPTENWGTFTAAFPEGLRWDLPNLSTFGVALLVGYDPGRKEKIRTLGATTAT